MVVLKNLKCRKKNFVNHINQVIILFLYVKITHNSNSFSRNEYHVLYRLHVFVFNWNKLQKFVLLIHTLAFPATSNISTCSYMRTTNLYKRMWNLSMHCHAFCFDETHKLERLTKKKTSSCTSDVYIVDEEQRYDSLCYTARRCSAPSGITSKWDE